jgi:hypothetical protein
MSSGFFCWKAETIAHNFHEQRAQILMLAMTFWLANNIKNQPPNQWLATNYFLSPPINSSES